MYVFFEAPYGSGAVQRLAPAEAKVFVFLPHARIFIDAGEKN